MCACMCVAADQCPEEEEKEEEEGGASVSNHPETGEKRGMLWVIIKGWKREKIQSHEDAALAAFPLVCTCGGSEAGWGGHVGVGIGWGRGGAVGLTAVR